MEEKKEICKFCGQEMVSKPTISIEQVLLLAFQKLYDFNKDEKIEPEQYRKNIETIINIYKELS